jgi:copper homeostasis protein
VTTQKKLLEIACFNAESALIAANAGADRIELCENYKAGGVSPSIGLLRTVHESINIPLHVMVRPRPGDFVFTGDEFKKMIGDIQELRNTGIKNIVTGLLTADGNVDQQRMKLIIEEAAGMKITFHRAIDLCNDIERSVSELIDLGIHSVLTSGGVGSAMSGVPALAQLHEKYGDAIEIIAAGGIRSFNISQLLGTCCNVYHSAALVNGQTTADTDEIRGMKKALANKK